MLPRRLLAGLLVVATPLSLCAQRQMLVREYTFRAGESDSKLTARAVAMAEAKRLLLEEVASYVQASFQREADEDVNRFLDRTKSNLKSLVAGIVEMKLLEERWNGETYCGIL